LPSERKLVKQLQVSRASLREAFRILEALGLIEVRPGSGAFVVDRSGASKLPTQWNQWLYEHRQQVIDLLEIREALEPKAAALAAERISPAELELLKMTLDKLERQASTGNIDVAVQSDIEFHDLISKATRNPFLINLNNSINYILIESRYAYYQDPEHILTSWKHHCAVFTALAERDSSTAAKTMLEHTRITKEAIRTLNDD